jgi:histidinol-phosphate aminotransferase
MFLLMPLFDLAALIRPHLLTLTPYSSARDDYTGHEGVFLDANENPLGSVGLTDAYNRYPDPHQTALKQRLAALKGVLSDQIFLGNGSDEPIDLLIRATCQPGQDAILIVPPTYGMYEVSANINLVTVQKVPLTADFQLDADAVLAALIPQTKIVWLCSPNNPSGNLLSRAAIRRVIEGVENRALVVVDEAYIDFADTPSWTTELASYPNLVVLQTLSKAWGLAGLRLGMCFASKALVAVLDKIKPPYNIAAPTQQLALEALNHPDQKAAQVAEILQQRVVLADQLRSLAIVETVYPSDANFLLVRFINADMVFQYLISRQVIVRDRSRVLRCAGCLRISVGTPSENAQLLAVLTEMSKSYSVEHT